MTPRKRHHLGEPALDLIESAVHLLRATPVGVHLVYHLASAPFVLGLLWFWSDMTRGAFADARLAPSALLLTVLYLVMKTGQAAFCARLRDAVARQPARPWTLGRWARLLVTQAAIQPWGFILIPLSIFPLLMVPFPWLVAMFQGASVTGDRAAGSAGACLRSAYRQALLWPGQNHAVFGLIIIVAFCILLDVAVGLGAIPWLAKTLFGITTDFVLSWDAFLNTTYLLAVVALTYLVLDPLLKAIYILRSFQADSIQTGEDLRARFATVRQERAGGVMVALLAAMLLLGPGTPALEAAAAEVASPATAPAAPAVDPGRLDESIREVLQGSEFTWRGPREMSPEDPEDPTESRIARWARRQMKAFGDFTSRHLGGVFRELGRLMRKLFSGVNPPTVPTGPTQVDWMTGLRIGLYVVLAAGLGFLVWMLFRVWSRRRPRTATPEAVPLAGTPDLRAENISADQLPEDGWLALAAEMAAKAEWRLALRAVYLASLAHLAGRELVRLAPFKSNYEYRSELDRRARAHPGLLDAFGETATAFERVWYGEHEPTPALFDEARERFESIRGNAGHA